MAAAVPPGLLPTMPKLRWAQSMTAGVEGWLALPDLPPDLTLTCARGTHTESMPENIMAALFYVAKPYAVAAANQKQRQVGAHRRAAAHRQDARHPRPGRDRPGSRAHGRGLRHAGDRHQAAAGDDRRMSTRCCRPSAPTRCWRSPTSCCCCCRPRRETDNFINAERLAKMKPTRLAAEFRPRPPDQGRRPDRRGEGEEDRRRRARRLPPGAAARRASVLDRPRASSCCRISAARTRSATASSPSCSSTISARFLDGEPLKEVVDRAAGY